MKSFYIDEFGTTVINNKQGNASTYILTAVQVNDEDIDDCIKQIETVAKQRLGGGELKSKNIGDKDDKRLQVLELLSQLPFRFASSIIDKRSLSGHGLSKIKLVFINILIEDSS